MPRRDHPTLFPDGANLVRTKKLGALRESYANLALADKASI